MVDSSKKSKCDIEFGRRNIQAESYFTVWNFAFVFIMISLVILTYIPIVFILRKMNLHAIRYISYVIIPIVIVSTAYAISIRIFSTENIVTQILNKSNHDCIEGNRLQDTIVADYKLHTVPVVVSIVILIFIVYSSYRLNIDRVHIKRSMLISLLITILFILTWMIIPPKGTNFRFAEKVNYVYKDVNSFSVALFACTITYSLLGPYLLLLKRRTTSLSLKI